MVLIIIINKLVNKMDFDPVLSWKVKGQATYQRKSPDERTSLKINLNGAQ